MCAATKSQNNTAQTAEAQLMYHDYRSDRFKVMFRNLKNATAWQLQLKGRVHTKHERSLLHTIYEPLKLWQHYVKRRKNYLLFTN